MLLAKSYTLIDMNRTCVYMCGCMMYVWELMFECTDCIFHIFTLQENASAGTQTSPRGQEGHNHPRGWIEQDKLGVTAVCLGIMLAIILLRKFLRSYGLESGVPLESGWEKAH